MIGQIIGHRSESKVDKLSFSPSFFRLKNESEKNALEELIRRNSSLEVFDEIHSQVEELIKCQNPKKVYSKEELAQAATEKLESYTAENYGVWVFYPWSNRLVHLLDEEEFIEVRTNRNRNKITIQERDLMAKQKIGVIGLSVGQSVAVTMAMERSFGEIRLADFDLLELTNLNRIRTPLYNLGIPKVVAVAREILEIDPFLKVTCFQEGLTEDNIDDFFLSGGKLNIVIDECDGLDIKILCRLKARELGIPVVMEASDKCTTDVERFDLEPNRSILHGFIDHLDLNKVKEAKTNEQKIPYLLPMLGVETITKRMKASMMEIEQTITTWPQLASAVALGGGITADICRRITIGEYTESGRYQIDVENLIGNKKESHDKRINGFPTGVVLTHQQMMTVANEYQNSFKEQLILDNETIHKIVEAGCQAPSAANNQPWKWFYRNGTLFLFHDESRTVSFGDYDQAGTYVSMGAAIENVILKAHELKLQVELEMEPMKNRKELVTAFHFFDSSYTSDKIEGHEHDDLAQYIYSRCTNRCFGEKTTIDPKIYDEITSYAHSIPNAQLQIIDNDDHLVELEEIMAACDRIRFMHPRGHHDFYEGEIRWTEEENEEKRDGIDVRTIELTESEKAGLQIAGDPDAIEWLRKWNGGGGLEKMTRKSVQTSSAIAYISMPSNSMVNYVNGGRSMQRAWIIANKNNVAFQPIMATLFLFNRFIHGQKQELSENNIIELENLKNRFFKVFPGEEDRGSILLFRLHEAENIDIQSLRLSMNKVLFFD